MNGVSRRLACQMVAAMCVSLIFIGYSQAEEAGPKKRIYFMTADSCVYCQLMKPRLAEAKRRGVPIIVADVAKRKDLARVFRVQTVPLLVITRGDVMVAKRNGYASVQEIVDFYTRH